MTWVRMRGRTLAVWRSMKLGAMLVVFCRTLTADDLCAVLDNKSAMPDEYSARTGLAEFWAEASETDLLHGGSADLMPSCTGVWQPDSFTLAAFCTRPASRESSWVCVDAAATATADADAGRADVTVGCGNGACGRGDTSVQMQQTSKY